MLIVTAKVKVQGGKVEAFIDAVAEMKTHVLEDPGVLEYSLHRSVDDSDEFLFYERYESREAFAHHLSTDHLKVLAGKIDPLFAAPSEFGHWVEVL